ncbi:calcium-binding protein [Albimonas sp. CAU 1670]|uniref:calcium-binding protein n=1 Tax=Albimonas sp. CAU 1670 TaxID=3032599 RepID=UPI0023D9E9E7|nr:calcium-binding protein [Albimonas sp. CAU 1670]MDF2233753.1 calcium-binding protein [Albimonas sp. CAU 1670]
MPDFNLISGSLRNDAQILDIVGTSDGGAAVLFVNLSLEREDDSEIDRLCLAFFRPDGSGGLAAAGAPKVIESENPSDLSLVAGIAPTDDGGILFLGRRLNGVETPVSRFTARLFDDEGRQVASRSEKFDGQISPSAFLERGAPDEGAQPTVFMAGTGELFGFNLKTGRMLALNQSVPTDARVLALDDGTLVRTPSLFDPANFASGFTLESVAGTGSDVDLDFLNVATPFTPTFSSAGNTAAALITFGGLRLAVAKPDAGAAEEAALDFLAGADLLPAAGAVEIAGVGYAVAMASTFSGEAQVQLVDFDGDLIATAVAPGAVSGAATALRVVSLPQAPGEGVRLLIASIALENTADGSRDASTATTVDLQPQIDVTGTVLDDFLTGFDKEDAIRGDRGDDLIFGHGAGDFLFGGDGDDRIEGGDGADLISGDAGRDKLFGEAGSDQLDGGEGADKLEGAGGADLLEGAEGSDALDGGGGNDTLNGGFGVDRLLGGGGKDALDGGDGDDLLDGGGGKDRLVGSLGSDLLHGGKAADRFVFLSVEDSPAGQELDLIDDFSRREGDRIDLTGIDARESTDKDDAFKFIGKAAFSERAGELRLKILDDGGQFVLADVDGDGRADFTLGVEADATLRAGDFLL